MTLQSALCGLGWVLCLWGAPPWVNAATLDCAKAAPVHWQAVAPNVWIWLPDHAQEISPDNQGRVLPISAVVDAGEALLVDPGPSYRLGQHIQASLACQFNARVRWVVNTHAHAESVLGNSAFADGQSQRQLDIAATQETQEAMQRRCAPCLSHLADSVGAQAMQGTRIVLPNRRLAEGDVLAVGRIRLQVLQVANAHTESDLLLWEPQRRILWAGGLVYEGRIPELAQGSLNGWLQALVRLNSLQPAIVISAAFSVAANAGALPPALEATRHYLASLRSSVLQAMDAGLDSSDTRSVQSLEHAHWPGYRQRHGFNVQRAWRELEPEWLDAAGPGAIAPSIPDVGR